MTAGTIFDEILVTDSLEEAQKFAEGTWATKYHKDIKAHEELKEKKKEEEKVSALGVREAGLDPCHELFHVSTIKFWVSRVCVILVSRSMIWSSI